MDVAQENPSALDMLNAAIRQVEIQEAQIKLEIQFSKNMAIFKEVAPDIYEQFVNHTPKELQLEYNTEGFLNLVNTSGKRAPVYSSEPRQFCDDQVNTYLKHPSVSEVSFTPCEVKNSKHIHTTNLAALDAALGEHTKKKTPLVDRPIGTMLLLGCGLGYQIPLMIEKMDIYNLVIFDPHKDSFYAALHTIDWEPIIKHFYKSGRLLKLFIGLPADGTMTNLKLLMEKVGMHNLVYTYIYRHYTSKKEEEFLDLYRKQFHLMVSGAGFFDDEQVSLSHTITNLNNRTPVLIENTQPCKLPPAFIIANGPSLDKHIDVIRENKDNAILFSCGTTLGTLAKLGIKPDFHVEMERNVNITEWIEHGTTSEYRKGITLLALNTIAPNATELFDDVLIAMKPNDIGESLMSDAVSGKKVKSLALCNPTVTNTALSYVLSMGFKDIYLMGVDLGYGADGKHHSNLSLYSDIEGASENPEQVFDYTTGQYPVKGNKTESVFTTATLDTTRIYCGLLLRNYRLSGDSITCYNSNDGAFIDETNTIDPIEIAELETIKDKESLISTLKNTFFSSPDRQKIDEKHFEENQLKHFFDTLPTLLIKKNTPSATEFYDEINRTYLQVKNFRQDQPITTMLLRGSLQCFFTYFVKSCLYQRDPVKYQEAYNICYTFYSKFLDEAGQFMRDQALQPDDTWDEYITRISGNSFKKSN